MRKVIVLLVLGACAVASAQYGMDSFGFTFWTNSGGSGTIGGGVMQVIGGDSNYAGDSEFQGIAPATGVLDFDWTYSSTDYGDYDQGYYDVNNVRTKICNNDGPYSGHVTKALNAGDHLDIGVYTADGVFGPGILTVTNFNLTPEPASLALLALATLLRRR